MIVKSKLNNIFVTFVFSDEKPNGKAFVFSDEKPNGKAFVFSDEKPNGRKSK